MLEVALPAGERRQVGARIRLDDLVAALLFAEVGRDDKLKTRVSRSLPWVACGQGSLLHGCGAAEWLEAHAADAVDRSVVPVHTPRREETLLTPLVPRSTGCGTLGASAGRGALSSATAASTPGGPTRSTRGTCSQLEL